MITKLKRKVIIIAGSSGVGKGSIIKKLLSESDFFELSVSMTTRKMRPGEIEGGHYYFRNQEEFRRGIKKGLFIEYVSPDNSQTREYYGTLWSEIKRINSLNKFCILDLDLKGLCDVKEKYIDQCLSFYIHTSFNNRNRWLIGRDKNVTNPEDLNTRLERGKAQDNLALSETFQKWIDFTVENEEGQLDKTYQFVREKIFSSIEQK